MSTKHRDLEYESPLAPLMEQLVREKRACGYKYDTSAERLKDFDRFLCQTNIKANELPKSLVLKWLEKRPTEKAATNCQTAFKIDPLSASKIDPPSNPGNCSLFTHYLPPLLHL